MAAVTDPARKYRTDPGHPEICNIHKLDGFFNPLQQKEFADRCRRADIGCVEHKAILAEQMNLTLRPFRERRATLDSKPKYVSEVIADGAQRAQVIARQTIKEVKARMGLS
jgi:tryptophanyl-tRNA synthetase